MKLYKSFSKGKLSLQILILNELKEFPGLTKLNLDSYVPGFVLNILLDIQKDNPEILKPPS